MISNSKTIAECVRRLFIGFYPVGEKVNLAVFDARGKTGKQLPFFPYYPFFPDIQEHDSLAKRDQREHVSRRAAQRRRFMLRCGQPS
jgi:hypothetical protein